MLDHSLEGEINDDKQYPLASDFIPSADKYYRNARLSERPKNRRVTHPYTPTKSAANVEIHALFLSIHNEPFISYDTVNTERSRVIFLHLSPTLTYSHNRKVCISTELFKVVASIFFEFITIQGA
ncbi:hypothetical protein RF11_08467 [Thelohanellus kitauei]|uniref:Uncharacterized protein n=1 Tax=Thelohanellus kitauei TaxID=669202 RepID=A0A0C2MAE2_THEKT|nr:hypothetical protein RF11_08467 [Thelohanellus kitauei]